MGPASTSRLTRLKAKNFKSLVDVDVRFQLLTVLVGPNAAGKSNTLGALRFLRDALVYDLRKAFEMRGGFAVVMTDGQAEETAGIELLVEVEVGGREFAYGFECGLEPTGLPVVHREWFLSPEQDGVATGPLDFHRVGSNWRHAPSMLKQVPRVHPGSLALPLLASLEDAANPIALQFLQGMRFFHISPDMAREPQRGAQGRSASEILSEDGHNLGPALLSLRNHQTDAFASGVLGPMAGVLPDFAAIDFERVGAFVVTKLTRYGGSKNMLDLSSESNGTLLLLGNLAALRQPPPVTLVAIEEPENALHPAASKILAEAILEATMDRQVLITTHSPDLLDSFPDSAILVVENVGGRTRIGPVATSQRQAIRDHLFHAGELMRMEGLMREAVPDPHA